MNYTIRKAEKKDITEIIALCGEHAEYEQAHFSPEGKAKNLSAFLFSDKPRLHCLIVEQNNQITGYATYMFEFSTWDAGFYTHMDCLYLRPDFRGFGIGEALVHEIAKHSKRKGIEQMQWHTPQFNTRAVKFYRRIGAQFKEKIRFYYSCK